MRVRLQLMGLLLLATRASAQTPDAPGGAPAAAAPAPAAPSATAPPAAPGTTAKAAAKAAPAPIEIRLAPGYGNLAVRDSQGDFYHYNRPPSGFFLGLLQATHQSKAGYPLQEFWWRNLGTSDQKGYLDVHGQNVPSYLRFWRNTADFYGDPQLPGGAFSNREDTRALVRLRRLAPSPALDLFVWDQRVNIPTSAVWQPFPGVDYHAPQYGLRAMLPVGGGQLFLEPRRLNFSDHTGRQPGSDTNWLAGEFVHSFGSLAGVSAAYDRITTGVNGRDNALWNIFRLQGSVQTSRNVFVEAYFRQRGVNQPFTQTTYENRSSLESVNFSAYPAPHSSVRAGLFREDLRRQDGTTGQLSYPAWTGGSLQLRTARPGLGSFVLRYRDRGLKRAPGALIPGQTSTETLYYTRDRAADARLDGFLGQRVNGYLSYGWRQRKNEQRDSRLSLNSATLGATAQASSRLSLTAEFTQQRWSGNTQPFLQGEVTAPGNLPPRLFFSNAHIFTGGLAYQIDGLSSADLTYNMFNSTGGQSARDHLAILEYRRDVSSRFFYSIGYQYEDFRDIRQDRKYTAFPILLQVGLRRDLP